MKKAFIIFLVFFTTSLSLNIYAEQSRTATLAEMLKKTSPAIVNIKSQNKISNLETIAKLHKEKQERGIKGPIPDKFVSVASGVIVDAKNGYIITNAHVIDDAEKVFVTLKDGRHYNAKIIGLDKPSDVALIQIKAKNLIQIPVANSTELKVGDSVAAIGNPFGLNQTVTSGIVSALGRTALGIESYENFIQTDASINSGNSGGALINNKGQLVGINTAILAPNRGNVGIGFAIPSNIAIRVMKQLVKYGDVKRGALGIGAQDLTPDLLEAFNIDSKKEGSIIAVVMPNSPAEKAGLKAGDIITAINGMPVTKANDVVSTIAFMRVNTNAKIDYIRDGKNLSLNVKIKDPKERAKIGEKKNPLLHGVGMKDFDVESPVFGHVTGVIVTSVDEDSNAWHATLSPGDVIVSANKHNVSSVITLQEIASNTKNSLLLNVLRTNGAIFLVINKEQ